MRVCRGAKQIIFALGPPRNVRRVAEGLDEAVRAIQAFLDGEAVWDEEKADEESYPRLFTAKSAKDAKKKPRQYRMTSCNTSLVKHPNTQCSCSFRRKVSLFLSPRSLRSLR